MAPLTHTVDPLETVEDSALVQLVYVSSITLSTRLKASIFDEVEGHARDYNEQHGITGTLCYGNGHFLQCIEGKKSNVLALQKRIFADSRHKNVQVLLLRVIDQRSFADWRMRLLFLSVGCGHQRPRSKPCNYRLFYRLPRMVDLEAYGAIFADYQNV